MTPWIPQIPVAERPSSLSPLPTNLRILRILQSLRVLQKKKDQKEEKPRVVGSHGVFKAVVTCTNNIYEQTQRR